MSGLTLVTPPACDPVSLAEAKAHLRITESSEDPLLVGYLLAARTNAEDFLGRALISRTYDLKFDYGWPCVPGVGLRMELPLPPTASVTSVKYIDTNGAEQTLAAPLYQVSERLGFGVIEPAYGQSWPSVRCQRDAITVRFVAGYGSQPGAIPEPIRQAVLLLLGNFYENRETVVVGSIVTELPMGVRALLSPYAARF